MATLLYEREGLGGQIETVLITFDATVLEKHQQSVTVTDHQLENGSTVADHIRVDPAEVSMQAVVSDTPVLTPLSFVEEGSRPRQAYDTFVRLMRVGTVFDVRTNLRDYDNMVVTSVAAPQNVNTANIAELDIGMREIRFVSAQQVAAQPRTRAATAQTQQAAQPTQAPDDGENSRGSLAVRAVRALGGLQ